MKKINNFVKIDSEYGPFIVNRHCSYQAEHLIKTGRTHIEPELNKILAIAQFLPEECIVVDAGANIGMVALPLAHAIAPKNGVIHAFETQRMMAYALCGTIALNDLENVFVHHKALGSISTTIEMKTPNYAKPQDFGMFSLVDQAATSKQTTAENSVEKTDSVTIDSLNLPRLDFLKIDVEGMEIDVLKGCQDSLKRHLPWCWIEYWKVDIEEIKQQFSELDYEFYIMDELNMLCVPLEKSKNVDLTINAKKV